MTAIRTPGSAYDANALLGERTRMNLDRWTVLERAEGGGGIIRMRSETYPRVRPVESGDETYIETLVEWDPDGTIRVHCPRYQPRTRNIRRHHFTRGMWGRIADALPTDYALKQNRRNRFMSVHVRAAERPGLYYRDTYPVAWSRSMYVTFHPNCDLTQEGYRVSVTQLQASVAESEGVEVPPRTRALHRGWAPVPVTAADGSVTYRFVAESAPPLNANIDYLDFTNVSEGA